MIRSNTPYNISILETFSICASVQCTCTNYKKHTKEAKVEEANASSHE